MKSDRGMWQVGLHCASLPACLSALPLCLCVTKSTSVKDSEQSKSLHYHFKSTPSTTYFQDWLETDTSSKNLLKLSNPTPCTAYKCAAVLAALVASHPRSYLPLSYSSEWLCSVEWTLTRQRVKGWHETPWYTMFAQAFGAWTSTSTGDIVMEEHCH